MEVTCKENCRCCETCKDCLGFQKILDLKNIGLVIYRHTDRIDEVNETSGLLKSSINIRDDIFIIRNTKDTQIKADECIKDIDEDVSCARCRELIQRTKKYLRDVPPIDKKDIISVCDHCQQNKINKKSLEYCKCHEILKKYHAQQVKDRTLKEQTKTWLTNVRKLLENITEKSTKNILQRRSYSDCELNKMCKTVFRSAQHLKVKPMLEKRLIITESVNSIESDTKSQNSLKVSDFRHIKSKSVLFKFSSLSQVESYVSPSVTTYDTPMVSKSLNTHEEELMQTTQQNIKGILQQDTELALKIKTKCDNPPLTIRKCFSEEDIFYSASALTDYDMVRNFSYVFPKEINDEKSPLRRAKTSAELIIDTREMLNQRAADDKNKQKIITVTKEHSREKLGPASEDTKIHLNKRKSVDFGKNVGQKSDRPSSKKTKSDEESKSDKDKIPIDQIQKKVIESSTKEKEQTQKGMGESLKEKQDRLWREQKENLKEKQEQLRREKEEKQKEKQEKIRKEKEEKQKEKQEQLRKEKEEKEKEKQEQLRKEKEEKQREKQEHLQKEKVGKHLLKDEKQKNTEKKVNVRKEKSESSNVKKQQEEGNHKLKMEADRKKKEEAERKLKDLEDIKAETKKELEKPKVHKTQEEPTSKELNIKQTKMKMQSTDDLILQLMKLRQSLKLGDRARPKRLSDINITPLMVKEHSKTHKNKKTLNCLMCMDSDLALDVENIVNVKSKTNINDIIVGNKILKSKQPPHETTETQEMIPILYKSLYKEDMMSATHKEEHAEKVTNLQERKPIPPAPHKYVSTRCLDPNIFVG